MEIKTEGRNIMSDKYANVDLLTKLRLQLEDLTKRVDAIDKLHETGAHIRRKKG